MSELPRVEIARHGFLHEHPRELSDDEEAHWLDRGIEVIAHATGRRPRGWRAPLYNFSHRSADLLAERGFAYDASLMGVPRTRLGPNRTRSSR